MSIILVGNNLNQLGDNGTFESDVSTWGYLSNGYTYYGNFNAFRTNFLPYAGSFSYSGQIDDNSLNFAWATRARFNIVQGKTYTLRAYVRTLSANLLSTTGSQVIKIENIFPGESSYYTVDSETTTTVTACTDTWTFIETRITANLSALVNGFHVHVPSPTGLRTNGGLFVDNYFVYEYQDAAILYADAVVTNLTSFQSGDGQINITASGGTAPYSYQWNDGPTTEDRTGLNAGTYGVTVTDSSATVQTYTVSNINVTQPAQATNTLIFTIELLTDHTEGGSFPSWTAGSVITVFYKGVNFNPANDNAYEVRLNNSIVTSGPIIKTKDVDWVGTSELYQVCNGTTRYYWGPLTPTNNFSSFPYKYEIGTVVKENHYSCVAQSCDVAFVGAPTVTPATDNATNDGRIIVEATSSYLLRYTLDETPDYNTAIASGDFQNLASGVYNVTAIDQYGCQQSIEVTVGTLSTAYGVKYRLQYYDLKGDLIQDELLERGYSGAVTDIIGSGNPSQLNWLGDTDDIFQKYVPLRGGQMTLNVMSVSDYEYIDLFTQDDRKYQLRRNRNSSLFWMGYVVPSVYSEPWVPNPYPATLSASDGLQNLDNILFQDNNDQNIYGSLKLIKIVSICLNKLDISLNIRVAANMYDSQMATTAADDPFDQAYLDVESFIDDNNEPISCGEVLRRILKVFGAFVCQANGYWWVVRYEELIGAFDYREFTYAGEYSTNGSYNPLKTISGATSSTRLVTANLDAQITQIPVIGKYIVKSNLNERGNIIDGTFEKRKLNNVDDDNSGFQSWTLIQNGTTTSFARYQFNSVSYGGFNNTQDSNSLAYIASNRYPIDYNYTTDKVRVQITHAVDKISNAIPFLIVQLQIRLTYITLTDSAWVDSSGEWSNTERFLRFYPSPSNGTVTDEIVLTLPNGTVGEYERIGEIRVYPSFAYQPEYTSVSALKAVTTTNKQSGYRTMITRSGVSTYDYYELEDSTDAESDPDVFRPNDYATSTNEKVWKLIKRVPNTVVTNDFFYVERVDLDVLPDGQEPSPDETITVTPNRLIKEKIETELDVIDLPVGENYISNSPQTYNNHLKVANGSGFLRTKSWTRDGFSEAQPIQQIYVKQLVAQYQTVSKRLSGTFHGDIVVTPVDCLQATVNGQTVKFIIASIEDQEVRQNLYTLDLIELKAALSGGVSNTRAFTSGFTNGYT